MIVLADPAKDRERVRGGKGFAMQLKRAGRRSRYPPGQLSLGGLSISRNYPAEIFAGHLAPICSLQKSKDKYPILDLLRP